MKRIFLGIVLSFLMVLPLEEISAEAIKPDIRNYDVFVEERPMPIVTCMGKEPEEWIAEHIGYNRLQGDNMKFSKDLFTIGDQVEGIAERLSPSMVKTALKTTMDEPGNKPSWVGSICYYRGSGNGQIKSSELIEAADPITSKFKQVRFGNELLSSYIALGHLKLEGSTYNTQKDSLSPDPQKQSTCDVAPPGVIQDDKTDKGTGVNTFWSLFEQLQLAAACAMCACENTKMYIKTDSTIQYDTFPFCQSVGCTNEEVAVVDTKSQADDNAKNSGGWINMQTKMGLLPSLNALIKTIFGSITGKVDAQETKNKVNSQTAPSSYYTTKSLESGMDFLNCKLFPYAKRDEMPECKTNWIKEFMDKTSQSLQGSN